MSGQSPVTGSLFAPFFFPLGIAFMGAQSAVMMKMAGENWQYGKRRISAMTNEEFNKLTPIRLYQIETAELQAIIPSIEKSLASMTPLTATIVTEMLNTFKVGAQATGAYLQQALDTPLGNIIKGAIVVWMPWLIPLLDKIPDLSIPGETVVIPDATIESPEPPTTPPRTPEEIAAGIADTTTAASELGWQKIVGSGHNKTAIQAAIKRYTLFISQIDAAMGSVVKSGGTVSQSQKNTRLLWLQTLRHYQSALSWLAKQGTGGAKVTP